MVYKTIIKHTTPEIVNQLFPDNKFLVLMMLSTIFESIMRVDEKGSAQVLTRVTVPILQNYIPI